MSRDSRSWRSAWRRTPEPLLPQALPESRHHPHPALRSALCSQGSLPPPCRVVCMLRLAIQPLLPALAPCAVYCEPLASSTTPNLGLGDYLGGAWPAAVPLDAEQSRPGRQVSFPICSLGFHGPQQAGTGLRAGFSVGWLCFRGDARPCLEAFLVVTTTG